MPAALLRPLCSEATTAHPRLTPPQEGRDISSAPTCLHLSPSAKQRIGMMLPVFGLMFVWSLSIGASIQATERRNEGQEVFTPTPQPQITPREENVPDVFAMTSWNISKAFFEVVVNWTDSPGDDWNQNSRINWHASSLATGEEVVQRVPCTEGWGAVIECTLPGSDTVPTFCFKEQNPTRAACTMCVAQLIDSCVRAGAEEEDDVFVTEDCQCGGGPP